MSIRIFRVLLGVFLAMPAFVSVAQDHQYPVRPITLIVPFAPGGSSDLLARKYANLLEKNSVRPSWSKTVVVALV